MANPTIGATTPRVQYTATASQTVFTVPFEFIADADLAVYVGTTLQTLTTNYTVTGANTSGGGSITFTVGRTAGEIVTILGNQAYSRTTNKYTKYGLLPAETLEGDFDATTVQLKQLARDGQFAIRAPQTDSGTPSMVLPAKGTRATKVLGFDSNGNPVASTSTVTAMDSAVTAINTIAGAAVGSSASISHISAGTGAQPTTVQAKLRETVSIKDFGAVGDGVTNDRTALANAVSALSSTGGEIYFPPGTYLIGTSYQLTTNKISLRGVRGASIIKAGGSGDAPIYVQGDDIEISSLKFLGDQSGGASARQALIYIGGSGKTPKRISIHHNDFENASSSCIIFGTDGSTCSDINIHHNTMMNFWECGVDSVGAASNVYIHNNIIKSNTVHPNALISRPIGVAFENQVNNAVIDGWFVTDNSIDFSDISVPDRNVSHGISFGKASSPPANSVLRRGIISRNTLVGVGQGMRITDTRWGTNSYGVNLEISDNILIAVRDHAMYVRGGEDATYFDQLTIVGNVIKGFGEFSTNSRDGIHLDQNWQKPIVNGNWINNRSGETGSTGGRYGINIASSLVIDANIGNNTISGANSGRINDASSSAMISVVEKSLHLYASTNATLNGNIDFKPSTGSVIFRSPGGGVDRSIVPSTSTAESFSNGNLIAIGNTGTTNNLIFDPSGINVKVGPQSAAFFVYDGPAAAWRQLKIGTSVAPIRDTSTNIASVTATINTVDKYIGKMVWDTTNNRLMVSAGSSAASVWWVVDGSTSVTPT